MTTRRQFVALLGRSAAAWPLTARAQQADRVRRISVVNIIAENDPEASPRVAAFEAGLRKLGWAIERDVRVDYYWDAGDVARSAVVAKQVAETSPDVVVTAATPATKAIRDAATGVPIVFVQAVDPVGTGLVASLARPGANVTGFSNFEFSIGGKWLELLKEIMPDLRTVALLFNPMTMPGGGTFYLQALEAAAPSFAVKSSAASVQSVEDIPNVFSVLAGASNAGLIVLPDTFTTRHRDLIISLAAAHRLPAVYPFRYFATQGGLLAYGIDTTNLFRQAASYVDRILKGAKPADLPVQQPTSYELVINLKTARALDLSISATLLALADEVIE
jgi:putative tryptophan/tyrosine transport system substrate-binding protein